MLYMSGTIKKKSNSLMFVQGCHYDFKLLGKYNKKAESRTARDFPWFYFSGHPPPPPLHPTLNNRPVKLVELEQNDMNQCHAIAV